MATEIADGAIATADLNASAMTNLDNSCVRRDGTTSMTGTLTISMVVENKNSFITSNDPLKWEKTLFKIGRFSSRTR